MDSANKKDEQQVLSAKFEVGQDDDLMQTLASVDQDLGELPDGYGESRIMLMPRDPQYAYAYWDVPNSHKEELRQQGGQQLALRIYDVTDIDINHQAPHSVQEYLCDEMAREWYLPIPVSDRNYVADIGYRCADGRWLVLARSATISIPPVYPSDWVEDVFITVNWDQDLRGKTLYKLGSPTKGRKGITVSHDQVFNLSQSAEEQRVTGSLFGSMQQVPISSFAFPSGMGMSGVGFSASMPPLRPRKFWMIADAELIVYGATEPDATVTIGGRPIKLNPDGTFRFQMSFQDGPIDYPIKAVAKDGEQTRSIHMNFTRETLERRTNAKDDAVKELIFPVSLEEWLKQFRLEAPEQWIGDIEKQALQRLKELERGIEAFETLTGTPFIEPIIHHSTSKFAGLSFRRGNGKRLDGSLDSFQKKKEQIEKIILSENVRAALCLKLNDVDPHDSRTIIKAVMSVVLPVLLTTSLVAMPVPALAATTAIGATGMPVLIEYTASIALVVSSVGIPNLKLGSKLLGDPKDLPTSSK